MYIGAIPVSQKARRGILTYRELSYRGYYQFMHCAVNMERKLYIIYHTFLL